MGLENLLSWMSNHVAVLVAVIAAAIASFSALISRNETRKQRDLQAQNMRHNVDAQSLGWGNACIDALNRAAMLARTRQHQANDAGFFQQRVNMMLALQSLIERGRLFFPAPVDSKPNGLGAPPILEALKLVYHEIEALSRQGGPTAANSADFIEDCRNLLVTELQAHVDARRAETVIERVQDRPAPQRVASAERAKALKSILKSRRPGINLSDQKETVQ